jgi:hypothetical protein
VILHQLKVAFIFSTLACSYKNIVLACNPSGGSSLK